MTNIDIAAFLIAGIIGALGSYYRTERWPWGGSVAWAIIAIWALLKLLRVIA